MSDTPADTATTETTVEVTETTTPDVDTLTAELEKWKAQARKHEERAKANSAAAKELEQAKLAALSDQEKAVELARQQARAEAFAQLGGQLVDMAVTAAVAGRGIDAEALLDGLDRTRFLGEDGSVDQAAVVAWVDRIAPKPTEPHFPDLGQGARGSSIPLGSDPLVESLKQSLNIR